MDDYTRPTYLTPGSIRFSLNCSYTCTCELSNRIAAFGAIRRAAEVARQADRDAKELWDESDDPWDDNGTFETEQFAAGCRAAIRAAIGSPKA